MSCLLFLFLFFSQNVHLVARWLPTLDDLLQSIVENSHPDYRVFITGEAAPTPESHVIPRGILENSIKITNEPPTGMNASQHAALNNFNQVCCCSLLIALLSILTLINVFSSLFLSFSLLQDTLEMCAKEQEFNSMLFSLCFFHACVTERRKFGSQGWNKYYPFSTGDLTISASVLCNYLEANNSVCCTTVFITTFFFKFRFLFY